MVFSLYSNLTCLFSSSFFTADSLPSSSIHSDPSVPHLVNLKRKVFWVVICPIFFLCVTLLFSLHVLMKGDWKWCSFIYLFLISSDLNWFLIKSIKSGWKLIFDSTNAFYDTESVFFHFEQDEYQMPNSGNSNCCLIIF